MTQRTFRLPEPMRGGLALLPRYPGSLLFAAALNLTLAPRLPADTRAALAGKVFRIDVADASLCFDFQWAGDRFRAQAADGPVELVIAASVHDFYLLASRTEDPDTLFFSRRLRMEGDTELGLLVKNTLDAMELPQWLRQP